ncbi:MAG: molecular chaperone TorD family protein [Dehalococcoidia bacterium]
MPSAEFADAGQAAETRRLVYGELASMFNQLPDSDFVLKIAEQDFYAPFRALTLGVPASIATEELERGLKTVGKYWKEVRDVPQAELATRLGVDRTRLFRGLKKGQGPPPPYESVYRGQESVMGDSTLGVRKAYADAGYQQPPGNNEIPDYVGVELDFLRHLSGEEATAWATGDRSRALVSLNRQREFLAGHVLQWVTIFCDEVVRHAQEGFYKGMARVTKAVIILESYRLRETSIEL